MTKPKAHPSGRQFIYPVSEDQFVDEGLPRKVFSNSQFNTYRKCPRQYMYAYIQELIKPPGIALIKGSSIHAGAEVVHLHTIKTGELMSLGEASQHVSETFDKESKKIEDWTLDGEEVKPDFIKVRTISNFQVYYEKAVPKIKPVAAEKTFAVKIGTVPVVGVIDLIDAVPGEHTVDDDPEQPAPDIEVVSDLKTTGRMWPEAKIRASTQITLYTMVERTTRGRFDFLLDQKSGTHYKPKETVRTLTDKRLLVEDMEQVVDLIKKGNFPRCDPTLTNWVCTPKWCGYYNICKGPK
jgi:hypothetical protein